MEPLFTVSGLRGIVGESLTPELVIQYARAYSEYIGVGEYLLGRDTRPHGPMVQQAVATALLASGREVVDLGVVPTPTLLYRMRQRGSSGGVVITASHNPLEWNALKFARTPGLFLFPEEVEKIKGLLKKDIPWASWDHVGTFDLDEEALISHIGGILSLPFVDTFAIRKWRPKVAVDAVNGSMFRAIPLLLKELGAQVVCLNCNCTGIFPHNPEPLKENLGVIDALLKRGDADIGFASDPDGDRVAFGLKKIGMLSEEYTLPIALREILEVERYDVVVNLSTSMMVEKVASDFGVEIIRTPVGEANVVKEMLKRGNAIGGEGNGGVIFPLFNSTRDGLLAISLILNAAANRGVDGLLEGIPEFSRKKIRLQQIALPEKEKILKVFKDAKIDERDGLYIRLRDSWIHLRQSNTEPITRLYIEAPSPKVVEELEEKIKNLAISNS